MKAILEDFTIVYENTKEIRTDMKTDFKIEMLTQLAELLHTEHKTPTPYNRDVPMKLLVRCISILAVSIIQVTVR